MKTKIQIIDETVEFYKNNPRSFRLADKKDSIEYNISIGSAICLYNGPNDTHCAFARMCINPAGLPEGPNCVSVLGTYGESILKEEYRGHTMEYDDGSPSYDFYRNIQQLHDFGNNWDGNKLTQSGQMAVARLKAKYNDTQDNKN